MNAPGSPSSPVADDVFDVGFFGLGDGPFAPGGEARAAPATQTRVEDFFDDLVGGHLADRFVYRNKAVVAEVFIEVQRVDDAAVFGGDAFLGSEEFADGFIAGADGMFVGDDGVGVR